MNTRNCKHCNISDVVENFPVAEIINGKTYYRHLCVSCYSKQKYSEKKKRVIKFREYKKTLKCVRCGYDDYRALQFHHVNSDKEGILTKIVRDRSWDRAMEEINKCIVLCANCHQIEHYPET